MLVKNKEFNLQDYSELIETVAKVEYKKMRMSYLIDYTEVVSIGAQTIHTLSEYPEFKNYNNSYLSTAIKWAIRNEVRKRYRWYWARANSQNAKLDNENEDCTNSLLDKESLQSAVFSTILSLDDINFDGASVPPQIKDTRNTPDEYVEFQELKSILKKAIEVLPPRERDLIDAKFFKEKKLSELSDEFGISASRITRIIQSGLSKMKAELERMKLD